MIIKYVNSNGITFDMFTDTVQAYDGDITRKKLDVTSKYGKNKLKKPIQSMNLTVCFRGSIEDIKAKLDNFRNITDYDTSRGEYGRLYYNSQYLRCFITEATTGFNKQSNNRIDLELSVWTDEDESWIEEVTQSFNGSASGITGELSNQNELRQSVDFMIIMSTSTSVTNPYVQINGHMYRVNTTLNSGDTITINSSTKPKTVYKNVGGEVHNVFNFRDRDSYIFEQIPFGLSELKSNCSNVVVVMYNRRSSVKWS